MDEFDFDFSESAYWLQPDYVLADLVATLVNTMGIPIGITLFMKGMVLSGMLVSEREYLASLTDVFNGIAREALKSVEESMTEEIEAVFDFTGLVETPLFNGNDDEEDEDELDLSPPVRHLHLKDILVLTPQPSISFQRSVLPIMRIRLTMIDGWMLGQATGIDNPPENDNSSGRNTGLLH